MQNRYSIPPPQINILSLDIEEWFMLEDTRVFPPDDWDNFAPRLDYNTRKILDVLEHRKTKGAFYFLGWVAERYPDLLYEVSARGHEIGYHTYYHHNVDMLTPDSFESDLCRGLDLIKQITGQKPTLYRAPNFSMHYGNLWTIPILLRNGITVNSSLRNFSNPKGIPFPSIPFQWESEGQFLWELPLASGRLGPLSIHYAGSGYFRLLPDFLIDYFIRNSSYNLFYFHPRDFDPHPPFSPKLSTLRNLKNNIRTHSALSRLEDLIKRHKFLSISEALQLAENQGSNFQKITISDHHLK